MNVPDAGLAIYNSKPQQPVRYSYDPHLDPQLNWSGKARGRRTVLHVYCRLSTYVGILILNCCHMKPLSVNLPSVSVSQMVDLNSFATVVNLLLIAVNLWLVFRQYSVQSKQFQYERKPQIVVDASTSSNEIRVKLSNQGTILARNISLNAAMFLDSEQIQLGKLSVQTLNPDEKVTQDLSKEIFASLASKNYLFSYTDTVPGKKDEITGETLYDELSMHHLKKLNVSYQLTITGTYGNDVSSKPIFEITYEYDIDLRQLDYAGDDHQYEDDFDTVIRPHIGLWSSDF